MAIVIPDLFGAFQKGREYAIDRNWKDLTNYEAIEKARNENDLGALNLLERRVMFAPKMGIYMDNADMSARNNALGGAAFPGLMSKTQAQSALDTEKTKVDMSILPDVMNTYKKGTLTSLGTANVESDIQQARNTIFGSKAKDIGGLRAEIEEAQLKYGAETAKNAYKNEIETNKIVQERLATILRQSKLSNSDLAILSEKLGVSIEFLQRLAGQVQANTEYSDATHQAGKTPQQREDEGRGLIGDNGKPLLNQEVEDYYLTGLSNGVDKLGERISPNQAVRALALLQSPENYDTLLKTKNLNEIAYVFANLGRIAGGGVVGGNASNTTVVPVKTAETPANNADKTAPLVKTDETPSANAGNTSDFRYDPMTGERIVQLVPYSQAVNNSAGNFYIRGDNTFTPYPYNMTTRPLSGDSLAGWSQEDIQRQLALQRALINAGYNTTDYPYGISLFDLSIRDPQNRILIPANQKAYYQQFGW